MSVLLPFSDTGNSQFFRGLLIYNFSEKTNSINSNLNTFVKMIFGTKKCLVHVIVFTYHTNWTYVNFNTSLFVNIHLFLISIC